MPYVVAQPEVKENIVASLLAKNASEVAAQQEWEAEWNQSGLSSRLSEQVSHAEMLIMQVMLFSSQQSSFSLFFNIIRTHLFTCSSFCFNYFNA